MSKRVFITGGAGFIGNHLARTLLDNGYTVTVFDDLVTGRNRVYDLMEQGRISFIKGNIRHKDLLSRMMKGHELVIHLAANTDIPNGHKDTSLDLMNCVVGTCNVLEAMRDNNIADLLFSSTAAVYGLGGEDCLASESSGPLHPISLYGAGKLACEGFISAYCHLFGVHACIFRFGNVVGSGMDHGVIYDLLKRLKQNPARLEVWGDGEGRKPFFLVEDCIRGIMSAYNWSIEATSLTQERCHTFNLGVSTSTKISEVVKTVLAVSNKQQCEIVFTGGRQGFPGDVPIVNFDTKKINSIGWWPRHESDLAVCIASDRLVKEIYSDQLCKST